MKWEEMPSDTRHALEMVGGRLYKESPHITLIHEIIANANDEFEKGSTNNPTITVDFAEYGDGDFVGLIIFKNNAPPIPEEFFKKDYHTMFKSSKSSESGGIGFVGIGAKQFLQSKDKRQLITITGNDKTSLLASIWQWPVSGNPEVAKTPGSSYGEILGSRKILHEKGTTFVANLTRDEFDDLKKNLVYYLHKWWNHALLKNRFKISILGNNVEPWAPHATEKFVRHFKMSSKKVECIFWISDDELLEDNEEFPHILYVVGDKRITDRRLPESYKIIKNYSKRIFCYADVSLLLKKHVLMSKEDFADGNAYVSKVKQRVVQSFWDFIREKDLLKEDKIDKSNDIELQMILQKFNEVLQTKEFKKWNPFLLKTKREVPVTDPKGGELLSESEGFQKSDENSTNGSSEGILGNQDGIGQVFDKKGDEKGEKKIRNALGIDIGEIDAPENEKEAWIDDTSRSLLINVGHLFYQKIQYDSERSGLMGLREFNKKRIMVDALVRFRIGMNDGTPAEIIEESKKLLHMVY
jgi:hypothetical protein